MDYVDTLMSKRELVAHELEELRAEMRRLAELIGRKEAQVKNLNDLLALEGRTAEATAPTDAVVTTGSFLDVAADILRGSSSGIYYRDLIAALSDRGITVPGQDPAANLIAHITRDQRFVRTARGTYGLRNLHQATATGTRRRVVRQRGKVGK